MSKKQTAVEWLEMEIVKLETKFFIPSSIYELCEQAKEREKEQIVNAWIDAEGYNDEVGTNLAIQYYNETYT